MAKDNFGVSDGDVDAEAADLRQLIRSKPPEYRMDAVLREIAELKAQLAGTQRRLLNLQAASSVFDTLLPMDEVTRRDGLVSEAVIRADELLTPEQGFYHIEHDDLGRSYRWTGPNNDFGFDMLINRSTPIFLSAEILGALEQKQVDELALYCDNEKLPLSRTPVNGLYVFTATLPAARVGRMTRLRFWVPELVRPSETMGSVDNRSLGVRFARLSIRPAAPSRMDTAGRTANGGATPN